MKKLKGIDGKLDQAWSELVKLRAGNKCEYCHSQSARLNSHHLFGRRNKSVRWDVDNGMCLCVQHHTFSHTFSAHNAPLAFNEWLKRHKGQQFIDILTAKANQISKLHKFEKELLLGELQKEIDSYG